MKTKAHLVSQKAEFQEKLKQNEKAYSVFTN